MFHDKYLSTRGENVRDSLTLPRHTQQQQSAIYTTIPVMQRGFIVLFSEFSPKIKFPMISLKTVLVALDISRVEMYVVLS